MQRRETSDVSAGRSFVLWLASYIFQDKHLGASHLYPCANIIIRRIRPTIMDNVTDYEQASARASRLSFLLDKSQIYAKIIGDRMARQQIEKRKAEKRAETRKANKEKEQKGEAAASGRGGTRGKKAVVKEEEEDDMSAGKRRRKSDVKGANKKAKVEETDEEVRPSLQVMSSDDC